VPFKCDNCGGDWASGDYPFIKFFRAFSRELLFCGKVCALTYCALLWMNDCHRGLGRSGE